VPAAADRDVQALLPGEGDRGGDVSRAVAAGDDGRMAIEAPVPQRTRRVVVGVRCCDHLSLKRSTKRIQSDSRSCVMATPVVHGAVGAESVCEMSGYAAPLA